MHIIAGLITCCLLASCAVPVRAYPPHNAKGQPTSVPVTVVKPNGAPVEPGFLGLDIAAVPWLEIIAALFGVKVGGDMLKGGARAIIEKRKAKHG